MDWLLLEIRNERFSDETAGFISHVIGKKFLFQESDIHLDESKISNISESVEGFKEEPFCDETTIEVLFGSVHFPFSKPLADRRVIDIDDQHDHRMHDATHSGHPRVLIKHSSWLRIHSHSLNVNAMVRINIPTEVQWNYQHSERHNHKRNSHQHTL